MFYILGADHAQYGPATVEEVRQWIRDGRADGQTMGKMEGGEWTPLAHFPEFADLTKKTGLPPQAPSTMGTPESRDFQIGWCFSQASVLMGNNFGFLFGVTAVIWLLDELANVIPLVGLFATGVLYGGLYLVYLKRIRGTPTSLAEAFSGFGPSFMHLLLAGFITAFLSAIGFCFCVAPYIYLKIAWIFALPLVIDRRLEFWTAMELSRTVTTRVWFKVFALAVIAFLPYLLFRLYLGLHMSDLMNRDVYPLFQNGIPDMTKLFDAIKGVAEATASMNFVGQLILLINLPFATAALLYAYEALFGSRPAPTT